MRLVRSLVTWAVAASALLGSIAAYAAPDDPPVDAAWGVRIPMRDGVELNATVYRPRGTTDRLPVVFTLTPYVADYYHDRAMYFASHGYVFVLVDARGRGNSQGKFEPFENEGHDGFDVVEWLARQPYADGKVAMWGGSYGGFVQWATLKEAPPHLVTIVPAAAVHPGVDFPFAQNIFMSYAIQWLTFTSGAASNDKLFRDGKHWTRIYFENYAAHAPFSRLEELSGNSSTCFKRWLAHPTPDAYWDAMTPTAEQYKRMNVPVLTITGDFDSDQAGALTYYRRLMQHAAPDVRAKQFLVIGPWDHAGTRTPSKETGGLKFADASVIELNDLHRQWYDWTMKDGKQPEFLKKPVAYYVIGEEAWKYAESLDAVSKTSRTLHLDSPDGVAGDVFRSGTLADEPPRGAAPDAFTNDPLDTRPGELEKTSTNDAGFTDQTPVLNLFGAGLVYHSAPFAEDAEVSGEPTLDVWLSMDVPDTDLSATLYEIKLDGTSVWLTSDTKRARYRESLRAAKPVPAGEIVEYRFDAFSWFSRRIAKSSRLRLVVGCLNSCQFETNFNGGGVVAEESGKDARTAHVSLHHDAAHRSSLVLPVVPATAGK